MAPDAPELLLHLAVRALLLDGSGGLRQDRRLVSFEPRVARIEAVPWGLDFLVLAPPGEDPASLQELEARVRAQQVPAPGLLAVLVIGGAAATREALLRVRPAWWRRSRVRIFHLAGDGRLGAIAPPLLGSDRLAPGLDGLARNLLAGLQGGAPPLAREEIEAALAHRPVPDAEALFWHQHLTSGYPATIAVAAIALAMFALQTLWGGSDFTPTLWRMGASERSAILGGEVWRLYASAFLHIGTAHLLMNLWALSGFGPFVERLLGTPRYVVLYALCALSGSLASIAARPAGLGAGASGAIWGLMVAGLAASYRKGLLPQGVAEAQRRRGWLPLGVNLLFSLQPGIDLWAHLGGGVAGALLVALVPHPGDDERRERLARIGAWGLAALVLASLGAAIVQGKPWIAVTPPPDVTRQLPGTTLTLTAPANLEPTVVRDPDGGASLAIGDLARDPLIAELLLWRVDGRLADPEAAVQEWTRRLEEEAPRQGKRTRLWTDRRSDGSPVTCALYEFRGGTRRRCFLQIGATGVCLDSALHAGASAAWVAVHDRLPLALRGPGER
jgi:membrane associated rhomboid family serine protease